MIGKSGKNLSVLEMTADEYVCPRGQELLFHVKLENKHFDSKTGERTSKPRIQKFGRKAFNSMLYPSLRRLGYEIEILHDPEEWIKQHGDPRTSARKREAKPSFDVEKMKAELREQLKAELREELEAEMASPKKNKKAKPEEGPEPADPLG